LKISISTSKIENDRLKEEEEEEKEEEIVSHKECRNLVIIFIK